MAARWCAAGRRGAGAAWGRRRLLGSGRVPGVTAVPGLARHGDTRIAYELVLPAAASSGSGGTTTAATRAGATAAGACPRGERAAVAVLLSGLGSQLVFWSDELCAHLLGAFDAVVRVDNRDVGLSSKTPLAALDACIVPSLEDLAGGLDLRAEGALGNVPYTLSDMALDTVSVLDDLGLSRCHLVGNSLGGMVAQTVAIEHPHRTASLTSIMSGVRGNLLVGSHSEAAGDPRARPLNAAAAARLAAEAQRQADAIRDSVDLDLSDPATFVERHVESYRATSGEFFDPEYQARISQQSLERCHHPQGWTFQKLACLASGDRTARLRELQCPALVLHGALDPLIPLSAGEETAAAIPGSRLAVVPDMAHWLPHHRWPLLAAKARALAHGEAEA